MIIKFFMEITAVYWNAMRSYIDYHGDFTHMDLLQHNTNIVGNKLKW